MDGGSSGITRRRFLGACGIGAATLAMGSLAGCASGRDGAEEATPQESPEQARERRVDEVLASLTLEQRIAQLFMATPESVAALAEGEGAVTEASGPLAEGLAKAPVGGLVYFAANLESPDQVMGLLQEADEAARRTCGIPLLQGVDEEGGTVVRIAGRDGFDAQDVGDAADIGRSGDESQARRAAERIADYLGPLGFNADFAPVCDVADNPDSATMAERSFGAQADLVAAMAAAEVEGFRSRGLISCAKHFPGIGAAVGDSHDGRISVPSDANDLEACELVPFQAAIGAGVPLVMVGHLSVPEVTGSDVPASLSKDVVIGLLRERLGFEGVIVTDSLSMGAVADYCSVTEAVVEALKAGCDVPLMPDDLDAALSAVSAAIGSGELTAERIDESVRRILRVKLDYRLGGWS